VSPAIRLLATKYRARKVGRTPSATRDLILPFNDLLKEAACLHGPDRFEAEREFRDLEQLGVVTLERASRDSTAILKVRLSASSETAFFDAIDEVGPSAERSELAALFEQAMDSALPDAFSDGWCAFCQECMQGAVAGSSLAPFFDRANITQIAQMLDGLPRLLSWESESMLRFASALVFGNSKTLETLQPRLEACLDRVTAGQIQTVADLGIRENPRGVILHGALTLNLRNGALDLGSLSAAIRIAADDVRAARLCTTAPRCVTVENASMLHELAKLRSGVILASSGSEGGFAHSAVIDFLRALPPAIERYHFGDSDPAGFDILRHLRERTGLTITSLHMLYRSGQARIPLSIEERKTIKRLLTSTFLTVEEKETLRMMESLNDKGRFEQESLGVPSKTWPFYDLNGQTCDTVVDG
jgi:hypothetical protein